MRFSLPWLAGLLPVLLACSLASIPAVAQDFPGYWMIIATGVACRDQPNVTSAAAGGFELGDRLVVSEQRVVGGEIWYGVSDSDRISQEFSLSSGPGGCWVFGALTTPLDLSAPEAAFVAMAEHALNRDEVTFRDLVAVENVLNANSMYEIVAASAHLQALRLQVIDRAANSPFDRSDPLFQSWMLSHRDLLRYWSIGLAWYVPRDEYWRLFEMFGDEAGAEELAWAGANAPMYFDECWTHCRLNLIAQNWMRYWERFPSGAYVDDAMALAIEQAERAGTHCILIATGYLRGEIAPIQSLVVQLRDSLAAISARSKDGLLALLEEIERNCQSGRVSGLDDPRAIPGLVRALGSGFAIVPRQLAGFGEQALTPVLEVLRAPEPSTEVAADGLNAVRYMLETQRDSLQSASALQEIRDVAERWLLMPDQSILSLGAAIDVAIVHGDPALREIVELLAGSEEEVMARGFREDSAVAFVQRRAAARLAGEPPLPRPVFD